MNAAKHAVRFAVSVLHELVAPRARAAAFVEPVEQRSRARGTADIHPAAECDSQATEVCSEPLDHSQLNSFYSCSIHKPSRLQATVTVM